MKVNSFLFLHVLPLKITNMLLSDELIEIGMTANPKNNMSMAESADKMHEILKQRCNNGNIVTKNVYNIVVLACDTLNKKGWKYFNPDLFFEARLPNKKL